MVRAVFIALFHAHVRHIEQQRVDLIGIAGPGVGDHHVHEAVDGERRLPGKGLVDPDRPPSASTSKSSGPVRKAERHAGERRHRRSAVLPAGFGAGGMGFGYGALKRNPPGTRPRRSDICSR